ncbi:class I SAM-dependent methyltransferase [Georgenia sp. SUBG003]|uniref:SAM-dependent methyltransferase n=1 Tax=Georgenia sp. SUBG003 TaxID=1497974 RepID=UPI000694AB52
MSSAVPARIVRAVDALGLAGGERVLEIGCGNGAAAQLVLDRHPDVTYVAVDRSAVAVARTAERNAAAARAGRLRVVRSPVERLAEELSGPFDLAFAVNVNVFWTSVATGPAQVLADLLVPGGAIWLFYDGPDGAGARRTVAPVLRSLAVPALRAHEADVPVPAAVRAVRG